MSKEVSVVDWTEKKYHNHSNTAHRTNYRKHPQHRTVDDKEHKSEWHGNQVGPLIDDEDEVDIGEEQRLYDERKNSIYNSSWLFTQQFILHQTPSRKDGVSWSQEIEYRRKGTTFIRDMCKLLRLKSICKETAYVYFHRFYILRSVKQYEPTRIAVSCLYLACKYADHPIFKDHLVKVAYMLRNDNKKITKDDKEYGEYCDQLILDENILLQVLGFHLQIVHFQVIIVESSQTPIPGTTRELYTAAFQIASEINRLTTLCVQYSSAILACVSVYLAACYKCITLPFDWCSPFFITANDTLYNREATEALVRKIGEQYRDSLATSQLINKLLCEQYVRSTEYRKSRVKSTLMSNCATNMYNTVIDQTAVAFNHNTFSPDSAYSSSSSAQSPHESQLQCAGNMSQINYHQSINPPSNPSSMMNYQQTKHLASNCYNKSNTCNSIHQNNYPSVSQKRSLGQDTAYTKKLKTEQKDLKMTFKRSYISHHHKDAYESSTTHMLQANNQTNWNATTDDATMMMLNKGPSFNDLKMLHRMQTNSSNGANHHHHHHSLNYPVMPN